MSLHNSLVVKTGLSRQRSVLSRYERIEKLQSQGKWREGDSIFKLPKVRTFILKKKKKKEKKTEEEEA